MNIWKRIFCVSFGLLFFVVFITRTYGQRPKVLVIATTSDPFSEYIQDPRTNLMATGQFDTVDVFNIPNATSDVLPTLAYLQEYNAVLFYTTGDFAPVGLGPILAQYVDGGGGVVLACTADFIGFQIDDAFNNSTYQVLVPGNDLIVSGPEMTLGAVAMPQHPIMHNVTTFDGGPAVTIRQAQRSRPMPISLHRGAMGLL